VQAGRRSVSHLSDVVGLFRTARQVGLLRRAVSEGTTRFPIASLPPRFYSGFFLDGRKEAWVGTLYSYDAFISYRHSERQKLLSNAIQKALQRFARPFWRFRTTRIFRDETNLSANPDLFGTVTAALEKSRCLILMASPEAAASRWVCPRSAGRRARNRPPPRPSI
jgi:hypothetical protein